MLSGASMRKDLHIWLVIVQHFIDKNAYVKDSNSVSVFYGDGLVLKLWDLRVVIAIMKDHYQFMMPAISDWNKHGGTIAQHLCYHLHEAIINPPVDCLVIEGEVINKELSTWIY